LPLRRFGVSVPEELVKEFDRIASEMGFKKRSKALRIAMRDFIADFELKKTKRGGRSNNHVVGLHRSRLRGGPNRRPAPL
jgi:metal-responsive CopG/Arc/MetJ family transcriptional regulator